jgi:hypothetical protein
MDCEQAVKLISARVDRELAADDRAAVEDHLVNCPSCRATADAFALQHDDLRVAFAPRRRAAAAVGMRIRRDFTNPKPLRRRKSGSIAIRIVAFMLGVAAAVCIYVALESRPKPIPPAKAPLAASVNSSKLPDPVSGRLVPRPAPARVKPVAIVVGAEIETKAGEQRRLALPGGGVLFVDQKTRGMVDGPGEVTLVAGAICCDGTKLTIKTPDRAVALDEGRVEVRVDRDRSSVFVAKGDAVAFPREQQAFGTPPASLGQGWELPPGAWQSAMAPRASARLSWMRDLVAASEEPLVPASSYDGGALIAFDSNGQEAKLSLRKYHIDVHIEDGFARTTIDQTYFNHHPWRLEGTFYFPLPADASLSRLAMYVDGKLMEGGMAERDYARSVYEQIITSQRDPALLEWVDGTTFKMRVFPLEGRQEKRIILSYTQRLPELYGKTTYRFPAGHSLQVVRDWSFLARIKFGAGIRWASPNHPSVQGSADGNDLVLSATEENVRPDRDVVVELDSGRGEQFTAKTLFASAELDGKRYFLLRHRPVLTMAPPASSPRNWVFVYESSASRDTLLARAQIEIIRHMLQGASPGDTFNVITAATRAIKLSPTPLSVTPENIAAATDFLSKTHLIGALDLGRSFELATTAAKSDNTWLVHVGSGFVSMGIPQDEIAKRFPVGVHYVGIGVGKRWNRAFMKELAEQTSGCFTQINPDESIAWRAFDLVAALNTTGLTRVTVTSDGPDGQEKPLFLLENSSLHEGEELCAATCLVAKDGTQLPEPKSITIRGMLDGKAFSSTLAVQDVVPNAGYLPRSWAKLMIDRLVAAGAEGNRNRIVELSKSMYVMSPFTSLLVLENEAMYAQFKVDRGRKDHWAMYPCPERIPVVYEPDPTQPVDVRNPPSSPRLDVSRILQTVLVRTPPGLVGIATGEHVQTAARVNARARSTPQMQAFRFGSGASMSDLTINENKDKLALEALEDTDELGPAQSYDRLSNSALPRLPSDIYAPDDFRNASVRYREPSVLSSRRLTVQGLMAEDAAAAKSRLISFNGKSTNDIVSRSNMGFGGWEPPFDPTTGRPLNWNWPVIPENRQNQVLYSPPTLSLVVKGTRRSREMYVNINSYRDNKGVDSSIVFDSIKGWNSGEIPASSTSRQKKRLIFPKIYERSRFYEDDRLFSDLLAFAPAMNTSEVDVQAVLEAEAAPDLRSAPGHIEPEARRLIEAARTGIWQSLTIPGEKGRADLVIDFDGTGRFSYEQILPIGLRERVVCDGESLLNLYPELGVGARRSVTRFHRAEFAVQMPWFLPPAEDLARGADIRLVDDHTVSIVPKEDGSTAVMHLVFAAGKLRERRIVAFSTSKVLAREVYEKAGIVRWLDADGKERGREQYSIHPGKAPELRTDTSSFVVVPLPMRTREHVFAKYRLDPSIDLYKVGNEWHKGLADEARFELLVTSIAAKYRGDARVIFEQSLTMDHARYRGLFTLMAACGMDVRQMPAFRQELNENNGDPLLRYLALLGGDAYARALQFLPLQFGDSVGSDGFLRRLAVFRDLVMRWKAVPVRGTTELVRRKDMERTLAFVRQDPGSPLSKALLDLAQDNLDIPFKSLSVELARARGILREADSDYSNAYEEARLLLRGGKRDEAARRFHDLYLEAAKNGQLPPFDTSIREALLDGDQWGALMTEKARGLVKAKQRPTVVAMAWQCGEIGDAILAENLLGIALDHVSDDERLEVSVAAVEFLRRTKPASADVLLRDLLSREPFSADARLWRARSEIASSMGREGDAIVFLERALDLEYQNLPSVVSMAAWRTDYGKVLDHCTRLAASAKSLQAKPPADLRFRIVQAVDRWREHDRGNCTGRSWRIGTGLGLPDNGNCLAIARRKELAQAR